MLTYEKIIDGIYLVQSDAKIFWKCNGLLVSSKDDSSNVLIDCNFSRGELRHLLKRVNNSVDYYIVSHVHGDHFNNTHLVERLGIKIYAPENEHEYLMEIEKFVKASGAYDFGVQDRFRELILSFLTFKQLKSVEGFPIGKIFKLGDKVIKTIHSPGHSPYHTTFIIESEDPNERKVLFTTDIGIEKLGAWYGFQYCSLEDYRKSILYLEQLYNSDDFILTGGHCPIFFKKQPAIFQEILEKMEKTEEKVLEQFKNGEPKGLRDITLKGLYYSKKSMDRRDEMQRSLYFFWEGMTFLHHIKELVSQGKLDEYTDDKQPGNNIKITEKKWILKK